MTPQQEKQMADLLVAMATAIVKVRMGEQPLSGALSSSVLEHSTDEVIADMLLKLKNLIEGFHGRA